MTTLLDPECDQRSAVPVEPRPRLLRTVLVAVGLLAALALPGAVVLLSERSAPGGGSATGRLAAPGAAETAAEPNAAEPAAGADRNAGTDPAEPAPGPGVVPPGPDGGRVAPGVPERVVKTGQVGLAAPDGQVSAVLDAVQRAARDEGGQVIDSRTEEQGERPYGSVTLRVPAARFEALLLRVRGLAEVRTASASGSDVTSQYRDLESRIRSLTAARDRFLTLLGRADGVAEVLSVQQHVDRVTEEIDQLEGQRTLLRDRSDFSTLTVSVSERDDPSSPVDPERPGFAAAFAEAWRGFTGGLQTLVRHSGTAAVLLLCAAAAGFAVRAGARRLRPGSTGPAH